VVCHCSGESVHASIGYHVVPTMVLVVAVHRQRSHKGFSFVCSFDDVVVLELLRGNRIGRRGITTRMLLLLLLLLLLSAKRK